MYNNLSLGNWETNVLSPVIVVWNFPAPTIYKT